MAPQGRGQIGFNPRPREGATRGRPRHKGSAAGFQSTPPRRGDHYPGYRVGGPSPRFQSTPPRRGDRLSPSRSAWRASFNPRPREGATGQAVARACRRAGFNPRPREGATRLPQKLAEDRVRVSIHAPAKGRRPAKDDRFTNLRFQSTPPRRGDDSISATVRALMSFNPRPREGATTEGSESGYEDRQFQSTPPRRGDNLSLSNNLLVAGFNPRPREGATMRTRPTIAGSRFQSTPPRRGDQRRRCHLHRPSGFQSTPPRRGDHQMALGLRSDTP